MQYKRKVMTAMKMELGYDMSIYKMVMITIYTFIILL